MYRGAGKRFGARTDGGSTDYFGDAVIVGIANSESLTIGSTTGAANALLGYFRL